jgi:hypothetical protein
MGQNLDFAEAAGDGSFINRGNMPIKVRAVSGGPGNAAAFIYQVHLNLDVDGAPNTYGWPNPEGNNSLRDKDLQKGKGADGLGNACGDPGDGTKGWQNFGADLQAIVAGRPPGRNFYWSSVVAIKKRDATPTKVIDLRYEAGRSRGWDEKLGMAPLEAAGEGYFPLIQLDGPNRGFFISTTSTYTDGNLHDTDPNKYVNGLISPYAVWANLWLKRSVAGKVATVGDFGLAINSLTGQNSGFFFGDAGTPDKVGEVSGGLYDRLGKTDNQPITFIVFPGSGSGNVMGKDPENGIKPAVLPRLKALTQAANAGDFPLRLANGPDMDLPRGQAKMTDSQGYKNIMTALKLWGWPST